MQAWSSKRIGSAGQQHKEWQPWTSLIGEALAWDGGMDSYHNLKSPNCPAGISASAFHPRFVYCPHFITIYIIPAPKIVPGWYRVRTLRKRREWREHWGWNWEPKCCFKTTKTWGVPGLGWIESECGSLWKCAQQKMLYFEWSPPRHVILTFFLAHYLTVQPHSIGSWQKQEAEKVDEEEGGKRGEEEEGGGAVPLLKSRDILTWQVGNGGYTPH